MKSQKLEREKIFLKDISTKAPRKQQIKEIVSLPDFKETKKTPRGFLLSRRQRKQGSALRDWINKGWKTHKDFSSKARNLKDYSNNEILSALKLDRKNTKFLKEASSRGLIASR